nr:helix-turn-helix transcriptional regulator [Parafrankia elaeagni]
MERARGDIDCLSRAGLELETFLEEATTSLRRAVPWVSACLGTSDPATGLLTSDRKYGDLRSVDAHDHEFGLLEYGTSEPTAFNALAKAASPAGGVHLAHAGDVQASGRMRQFMAPHFGFGDEARVVFREGDRTWGALALFRGTDDEPFDEADVVFIASLSAAFARGVRTGMLTRIAGTLPASPGGPAVLIVDRAGRLVQRSAHTAARLAELTGGGLEGDPTSSIGALIGAARRYAAGETRTLPRCRIRSANGQWFVLHASPLSGAGDDRAGEVVITIEEARPPEIVPLVVAAFGLTLRERDVTQLVLQGADTKEIAATLHLSSYTVQDHLKAIFVKAAVRSRRELISRIYFDQYVPRMGAELAPSGWFA